MIGQVALKKPPVLQALGQIGQGGTPAFDSDYQAILDYATLQGYVLPSPGNQATQNSLLVGLKSAGIWGDLDVFYNFFTDGDGNFAKINWKEPGTYQAIGTGHEPLFTILSGFKGNGVSSYLDTVFKPTGLTKMQTGNVGVLADVEGFQDGGNAFGLLAAGNTAIIFVPLSGPNSLLATSSANYSARTAPVGNKGFFQGQLDAGQQRENIDGSVGVYSTQPFDPVDSIHSVYLLAVNNGSVAYGFGVGTISCYGIGGKMLGKELALYNAWSEYKTTTRAVVAYKAIIDYATSQAYGLPSAEVQVDQRRFLEQLIRIGIWDELNKLYVFEGDGSIDFKKINWKDPGVDPAGSVGIDLDYTPAIPLTGAFLDAWLAYKNNL
jgi:hypothetical protein